MSPDFRVKPPHNVRFSEQKPAETPQPLYRRSVSRTGDGARSGVALENISMEILMLIDFIGGLPSQ
ncbi:MAG TPA: hypothetical protein VJ575_02225 [Pseudogulbenkiania sp.]|nr:hypothetical protein [Pseudogulbenkiania sp.]